jgi:hypothetical protein
VLGRRGARCDPDARSRNADCSPFRCR